MPADDTFLGGLGQLVLSLIATGAALLSAAPTALLFAFPFVA